MYRGFGRRAPSVRPPDDEGRGITNTATGTPISAAAAAGRRRLAGAAAHRSWRAHAERSTTVMLDRVGVTFRTRFAGRRVGRRPRTP